MPVLNAKDYLAIDDNICTGDSLSGVAILKLIFDTHSAEPGIGCVKNDSDSDDELDDVLCRNQKGTFF